MAEAENATVGSDQPVAVAGWSRGDADDWLVQREPTGRAEEPIVSAAEHAAVGRGQPVAARWRRRGVVLADEDAQIASVVVGIARCVDVARRAAAESVGRGGSAVVGDPVAAAVVVDRLAAVAGA